MADPNSTTTFFSYSREDSAFVLQLAKDLRAAGATVWLDQLDIGPGQRWDNAVEVALRTSPRQVAVLSPAAVNSVNVMDEVSFALEEKKQVIPVLYRDCQIPFRLRRVQYIDFRTDYHRGLRELLHTLETTGNPIVASSSANEVRSPGEVQQIALPERAMLGPMPIPQHARQQALGNPGVERRMAESYDKQGLLPVVSRKPGSWKKVWIGAAIAVPLAALAIWYVTAWYATTGAGTRTDNEILSEVVIKIDRDPRVPKNAINVRVSQGAVWLSGSVTNEAIRSAAVSDAIVDGVKNVDAINVVVAAARTDTPQHGKTAHVALPASRQPSDLAGWWKDDKGVVYKIVADERGTFRMGRFRPPETDAMYRHIQIKGSNVSIAIGTLPSGHQTEQADLDLSVDGNTMAGLLKEIEVDLPPTNWILRRVKSP
ncbi:MAG TPA: TIR domain-containing protein [Candidatus Angelobacter sp.]